MVHSTRRRLLPSHGMACSQMETAPLPHSKEQQPLHQQPHKHPWQVYAAHTPLLRFPKASKTERNAINTPKEWKSEAGFMQGIKPLQNRLEDALKRLEFVANNLMQKNLEP